MGKKTYVTTRDKCQHNAYRHAGGTDFAVNDEAEKARKRREEKRREKTRDHEVDKIQKKKKKEKKNLLW